MRLLSEHYKSRVWHHSQEVRQSSAKALFPSSNLGGASIVGASYISLALIFYAKIRAHSCRCSSFFAKRHARLNCSLVNALATFRCRYHLFASAPAARISLWFGKAIVGTDFASFRFFYCIKNQSHAPSFLLFHKRSHSRRLFGCRRPHNAFGSLPTFCECACGENI